MTHWSRQGSNQLKKRPSFIDVVHLARAKESYIIGKDA